MTFVKNILYKIGVARTPKPDSPKPARRPDRRTRRTILELLKNDGPQDAGRIAKGLEISAMAVRQHLYELQAEGLVDYQEQPRPLGRPAKLWRLTPAANRFFPDGHAELTVSLIGAVRAAFGTEGIDKLVAIRSAEQLRSYGEQLAADTDLRRKLELLAGIRTREGYMARVEDQEDGSLLFIENHCPICEAARSCTGLCSSELDVFRAVVGEGAEISRSEHILAGARRCAYRVEKAPAPDPERAAGPAGR